LHIFRSAGNNGAKGGIAVKKDEKEPAIFQVTDPKPPVIRSGHMENRRAN
jgi:hypothetical protein